MIRKELDIQAFVGGVSVFSLKKIWLFNGWVTQRRSPSLWCVSPSPSVSSCPTMFRTSAYSDTYMWTQNTDMT